VQDIGPLRTIRSRPVVAAGAATAADVDTIVRRRRLDRWLGRAMICA